MEEYLLYCIRSSPGKLVQNDDASTWKNIGVMILTDVAHIIAFMVNSGQLPATSKTKNKNWEGHIITYSTNPHTCTQTSCGFVHSLVHTLPCGKEGKLTNFASISAVKSFFTTW